MSLFPPVQQQNSALSHYAQGSPITYLPSSLVLLTVLAYSLYS